MLNKQSKPKDGESELLDLGEQPAVNGSTGSSFRQS